MKFHIFIGKKKQFFFRLVARNGKIVAASEGYNSRQAAMHTISRIRALVSGAKLVDETVKGA